MIQNHQHKMARVETVTPAVIAQLRKDWLLLVSNVPRVDTLEKYRILRAGVRKWHDYIEGLFKQIRQELESRLRVPKNNLNEEWAKNYRDNQKPLWLFASEVMGFPSVGDIAKAQDPEEVRQRLLAIPGQTPEGVEFYLRRRPVETQEDLNQQALASWRVQADRWATRSRKLAPACWAWLTEFTEWAAKDGLWGGGGESLTWDVAETVNHTIQGFQVQLVSFDERDSNHQEGMQSLIAGLHQYRAQAQKVYPWLLKNQLPLVAYFKDQPSDGAAWYSRDHIGIGFFGIHNAPSEFAHAMAHEMGHHIYQKVLSSAQRKFWDNALRGDFGPLDLKEVMSKIHTGESLGNFGRRIEKVDPVLHLQLETLIHDPTYKYMDPLGMWGVKRLIEEKGITEVRVPKHPITGYAGKNTEEAFCEVMGLLVGYGPLAVSPEVKKWFWQMQPNVRMAQLQQGNLVNSMQYQEFHRSFVRFQQQVQYNQERDLGNTSSLWVVWFHFYQAGREWVNFIIDHLAMPPKAAKPIEMSVRLFAKVYGRGKGPPDIAQWYLDNKTRLDLLDQAGTWNSRTEESGVLKIGPLTVHDTIQASPRKLENAQEIVQQAIKAINHSGVPGFSSMVYGQVYLVGQLKRKTWAAWYQPDKDSLYLRPEVMGSSIQESAQHLVHEFGHRFWLKKLSMDIKRAWATHHQYMKYDTPARRLPEVGSIIPILVNGKKPRFTGIDDKGKAVLVNAETEGLIGTIDLVKLRDWMQEYDHKTKFPTLYSASDAEEHFCESLSLYCVGRLTGDNLGSFQEIVLGSAHNKLVNRVLTAHLNRVAAKGGNYKNKKLVDSKSGGKTVVYQYSDRQIALRHNEKAKRLENLRKVHQDLMSKVLKDLTSEDLDTRRTALAVALMDETYERVGNDDSAEKGHYGVTGWLAKHCTVGKDSVTIKYVGKSGVSHEKVVKKPAVLKALKKALEGLEPGDSLVGDIGAPEVNQYLKDFDVTAKDLRGFHANDEMKSRLKSIRREGGALPTNREERKDKLKKEFDKALKETAASVGHLAATLRSQYLVPDLEEHWMKHGAVRQEMTKD